MLVWRSVVLGGAPQEWGGVMSNYNLNLLVGFGGVLLLGLIGFLYSWFSYNKRDRDEAKRRN